MENVGTKKRNPFLSSSSVVELLSAASSLLHQSPSATSPIVVVLRLLLQLLRLVVVLILSPLVLLLSRRHRGPHHKKPSSSFPYSSPAGPTPPAERALSHVLSVVSRVPVSSRKYELVKSLADRLLDDNLRFSSLSLNSAALSSAFSRTLRRLERASPPTLADRSADLVAAAVRSGLRRLSILEEEEEEGCSAEKIWRRRRCGLRRGWRSAGPRRRLSRSGGRPPGSRGWRSRRSRGSRPPSSGFQHFYSSKPTRSNLEGKKMTIAVENVLQFAFGWQCSPHGCHCCAAQPMAQMHPS
ncbi:putative outer envelope protein 64, mitochondrial [Iris pallida]|uniref:Outer envelope protein 64, mitochondrial n=1 Tax=Iris pallida TaxID=29817 RepID=A0AAX6DJ13_IRIPA|nr:putative outer envelope protein 64, mitochondrial [Iris pallida]